MYLIKRLSNTTLTQDIHMYVCVVNNRDKLHNALTECQRGNWAGLHVKGIANN